jgi:putative hydrolase of the HAD superfamily
MPKIPDTRINAVLFDADGVVQQPADGWLADLAALCGDASRADEFLADVFAAEKPCLTGDADFSAALASVLDRWNSNTTVDEALGVWFHIAPDPAMLDLVRNLRLAGVTVALATNQQPYRAGYMKDALGYGSAFDHLLFSCELGHAKPGVEYFTESLKRLDLAPAQALFLDDHAANVAAARNVGLSAEVFHVASGVDTAQSILDIYGISYTHAGKE